MKTRFDLLARCTPWLGVVLLASTAQAAVQSAPGAALDPKLIRPRLWCFRMTARKESC